MTLTLLSAVLLVTAPGPRDSKADPAAVEGDWEIVTYILGGKEDERLRGEPVRFKDGKFDIEKDREELKYRLDVTANPLRIDLTLKRDKEEHIAGIYRLDGDTLTLCLPKGGKGERPTKFESPADTDLILLTLKRPKKKD